MPSLLAMGAGAGQGLDDYLSRLMMQSQLDEAKRKNLAEEDYRNRALQETTNLRRDLGAQAAQARADALIEKQASGIEGSSAIGDVLDPRASGFLRAAGKGGEVQTQPPQAAPPGISAPLDTIPGQVPGQTTYTGTGTQRKSAADDAALQKIAEDPSTDPTIRSFLKMRAVLPKGENIPWQLLEPNAGRAPKSLQTHDVLIDGIKGEQKATYDPGTDKWSYAGQEIDPKRVHRIPPPPMFSPIQTGDVYGTFNRRTGAEGPMSGQGGSPVPLATTSSTRTMGEGARMLQPHIAELKAQAADLDKAGLFGPVMSRVRHAAETAGTLDEFYGNLESDKELQNDPKVGKFATSLGLMATGAGRVHGGARGGSSPQMLQHFKAMLGDASTVGMFNGRLDAVDDYMKGYAAGPGGASAAPAAGDPYQEYLNRSKK